MTRSTVLSLAGISALASGWFALPTPSHATKPITLRYKFRVGDVLRYRGTTWTNMRFPSFFRATLRDGLLHEARMRVAAVHPDGSATIRESATSTRLKFPFTKSGNSRRSVCILRVTSRNQIERVTPSCGRRSPFTGQGGTLHGVVLPERPVKPGDQWITRGTTAVRIPTEAAVATMQFRQVTTFRGIKRVNGNRFVDLALQIRGTANRVYASGRGTVVLRGDGELRLNPVDGYPTRMELQLRARVRIRMRNPSLSFGGTSISSTFFQRLPARREKPPKATRAR